MRFRDVVRNLHRRTVVNQHAVRFQLVQELVERDLRHGDQKIAVVINHRRADEIAAQNHRAVRGTAALLRSVGGEPGDVEVAQLAHRRKHDAETQDTLSAESGDFDAAFVFENLRLVLEVRRNADIEFRREKNLTDLIGIMNRRLKMVRLRRLGVVAETAEREVAAHLLVDETVDCLGVHLQIDRAGREDFDKRESLAFFQNPDGLADRFPGLHDFRSGSQSDTLDVDRSGKGVDHFADLQRVAVGFNLTAAGACGGFLSGKRGGRHLSAGHSVGRIVHEEDGHVFAAVRRLKKLVQPDCRKVAVALIGDDEIVGQSADESSSDRGGASVRNGNSAAVVVIVGEDRAADRGDDDGFLLNAMMLDGFRNEFVKDAVSAAGAVVHVLLDRTGTAREGIEKDFGFTEFYNLFAHFSTLLSESRQLFHRFPGPTGCCRPCGRQGGRDGGIQSKA